jgi:phosphoribosylaminoimidazole-succinocarboxamide synthase
LLEARSPVTVGTPLIATRFPDIPLVRTGKVRDVYLAGDDLVIVATDRISAFDYVLGSGIPDKGRILSQLSAYWFDELADIVPNHLRSTDVTDFPDPYQRHTAELSGRSMLVRRTTPVPIECVARGYLSGSGWKGYRQHGTVCGVTLPAGLRESERLPQPIFTPASKA